MTREEWKQKQKYKKGTILQYDRMESYSYKYIERISKIYTNDTSAYYSIVMTSGETYTNSWPIPKQYRTHVRKGLFGYRRYKIPVSSEWQLKHHPELQELKLLHKRIITRWSRFNKLGE